MPTATSSLFRSLVTTAQATEMTGLSKRNLYRLHADGRLNIYKIGGSTRWMIDELEDLVVVVEGGR